MLNEFVHGRLGFGAAKRIIPNIKRLISVARSLNIPILYICDSHEQGDYELTVWGPHAMKGTKEAEVIEELKPEKQDIIIEKRTYSGFYKTTLEDKLRELNIDTLILTGVHTHICVQHTAADAFFRGFQIIIPTDCVAAISEDAHESSLKYMEQMYKVILKSSEELILELKGAKN